MCSYIREFIGGAGECVLNQAEFRARLSLTVASAQISNHLEEEILVKIPFTYLSISAHHMEE